MSRLTVLLTALIIMLILSLDAQAAGFIKFDGVDGESRDKAHEKWIDVLSINYAVIQPRDAASGQATGKRQHKPITISKRIDKTTPLLLQLSGNNGTNPSAVLELTRVDPNTGREDVYFRISMKNVVISSYSIRDDDDPSSLPIEEVTLIFESIEWEYLPEKILYRDSWKGNQ